jgi:precorrin-6A/cobalt-precorrin-6A reductase
MSNILVLGGTQDARSLAAALASQGHSLHYSLAGATQDPLVPEHVQVRHGGFDGVDGLVGWCLLHDIHAIIDATHPFAARMSRNAVKAALMMNLPCLRLERETWHAQAGDAWTLYARLDDMVLSLADIPARRILLAIGRQDVFRFVPLKQHHFLVRSVEPPPRYPPDSQALLARGPFALADEEALLRDQAIDLIIAKNSGGASGYAKLAAARALGREVWLLEPPQLPPVSLAASPEEALAWVAQLSR